MGRRGHLAILVVVVTLAGCASRPDAVDGTGGPAAPHGDMGEMDHHGGTTPDGDGAWEDLGPPDRSYRLRAEISGFFGAGAPIDGVRNPSLAAASGQVVRVEIVGGEDVVHDLVIPELEVHSDHVDKKGAEAVVTFRVDGPGSFAYYCSVPGHRDAGMEGRLDVASAT